MGVVSKSRIKMVGERAEATPQYADHDTDSPDSYRTDHGVFILLGNRTISDRH